MVIRDDGKTLCFDMEAIIKSLEAAMNAAYEKAKEEWLQPCCIVVKEITSSDYLKGFKCAQSSKAKIEGLKPLEDAIRLRALKLRMEQRSQRQPQGDGKTTRLAASLPIPPLMNMKGGQLYALGIGG